MTLDSDKKLQTFLSWPIRLNFVLDAHFYIIQEINQSHLEDLDEEAAKEGIYRHRIRYELKGLKFFQKIKPNF